MVLNGSNLGHYHNCCARTWVCYYQIRCYTSPHERMLLWIQNPTNHREAIVCGLSHTHKMHSHTDIHTHNLPSAAFGLPIGCFFSTQFIVCAVYSIVGDISWRSEALTRSVDSSWNWNISTADIHWKR